MTSSQWATVIISGGILLVGLLTHFAVQVSLVTRLKASQETLTEQVRALIGKIDELTRSMNAIDIHKGQVDVRLEQIDDNTAKMDRLREEFTGFMGAYREEKRQALSRLDKLEGSPRLEKLENAVERLQRGQANLAAGKGMIKPLDVSPEG